MNLIFGKGVRMKSGFLHVCLSCFIYLVLFYIWMSKLPTLFVEKDHSFSIVLQLCQIWTGHTVWVYFYVFTLSQITHLEFCTFTVSLKIRECDSSTCILFLFSKNILAILVPLPLHINWNHLVYIYKNGACIFYY